MKSGRHCGIYQEDIGTDISECSMKQCAVSSKGDTEEIFDIVGVLIKIYVLS